MKGTWCKVMFELIKKIFIGLLISVISLTNQKCMIQLTVINLQPNQYSQ